MLRPCAQPATLCRVRTPHSRCAVPPRWTLRTAVVLVLVLALVSHNNAPSPSVLTMGVKSLPTAVNAATRPAAHAHHKSSSPQTQSPRATAVVPDQSLGTGPSAVKATATWCWGPWGIPCTIAWPMERCFVMVGLLFMWGCRGRPGQRWRMLRTTGTGEEDELQAMVAQGPASPEALGVLCAFGMVLLVS